MTNQQNHIKVDAFIDRLKQWQDEFKLMREIIRETELVEDYKWMHPCYTLEGKNVVIV